MPGERLRVTIPRDIGAAVRALAAAGGTTRSMMVVDAIAHYMKIAALDARTLRHRRLITSTRRATR